jgi:hypothetical protein
MTTQALTLERALAPLDRLRRAALLGLVRAPVVGALVARRDGRLMLHATLGVVVTFALTLACPGVLYVVGPALFGVAHVAADARYLVLRRALPRWWVSALGAGCATLLALRALELAFPAALPFAATELALGAALALAGCVAGALSARDGITAQSSRARAAALILTIVALAAAALTRPNLARLVFAHVHNVVAIALWLTLFRARRRFALPALALLAVAAALLLSGVALSWVRFDGPGTARLVDEALFAWPAWMPQRTAVSLGILFVLLQGIHYAVWLTFIPQDDAPAQGTRSFRGSWRALRHDFPTPWLAAIALLAFAVLAASLFDVHRTRQLYLSLATFHGYLELAATAYFLTRGQSASAPEARSPRPEAR